MLCYWVRADKEQRELIDMRPGAHYRIEYESFGNAPVRLTLRLEEVHQVLKFAKENLKPCSELFVACLGDGVDFGNFNCEVDPEGQATITAHEHRGFISTGLRLEQALNVLAYWLPTQARARDIRWTAQ